MGKPDAHPAWWTTAQLVGWRTIVLTCRRATHILIEACLVVVVHQFLSQPSPLCHEVAAALQERMWGALDVRTLVMGIYFQYWEQLGAP
eukprot:353724-Chlamydomonas_euryale.AAC.1